MERLIRGWDVYIPSLLASVADVRADVFEVTELQRRIKLLEDAVSKLEAQACREAKLPTSILAEGQRNIAKRK